MILYGLLLQLLLQSPAAGSLEGAVVRAGTRDPVAGVVVTAANTGTVPDARVAPPSATTDTAGRFQFDMLPAGTYRLLFSANGYVRQEFGQRTFPGSGTLVTVGAGQTVRDLRVALTPAGAVAGRIVDPNGRPLTAVPVRLMRYLYDESGQGTLRPYGTAQTDDRGDYRIYFVTPGRYYLQAGSAQGPGGYGGPRLGPNEAALSYSSAYYPGVPDINGAALVDVLPGGTRAGIDLTLARQSLYRVRGRVIDSATGQAPESPAMWLFHFDPPLGRPAAIRGAADTGMYSYDGGRFEFRAVVPGSYTIGATEKPNTSGNMRAMRHGFAQLDVRDRDIEDLVVTIPPGAAIAGRIALEGQSSPAGAFYERAVRFVSLTRTPDRNRLTMPLDWEAGGPYSDDGVFQLNGVTAGEYRVALPSVGPGFYVKEVRYGLGDALNRPFRFDPAEPARLDILLSGRVAQVSGVVVNARSEPAPGAQVVLVPNQRDRPELFKAAATDQNGRFTIRNAAPGDYRIFVWEAIEPYQWFDPDVLKAGEPLSTPVRLSESASEVVGLRVMPSR